MLAYLHSWKNDSKLNGTLGSKLMTLNDFSKFNEFWIRRSGGILANSVVKVRLLNYRLHYV